MIQKMENNDVDIADEQHLPYDEMCNNLRINKQITPRLVNCDQSVSRNNLKEIQIELLDAQLGFDSNKVQHTV